MTPPESPRPLEPDDIDPTALDALMRGAKTGAPPKRPWDGHDPRAPRKRSSTLRMNDYEHALLHYVAGMQQKSVQETLMALVRAAALADVRKREAR